MNYCVSCQSTDAKMYAMQDGRKIWLCGACLPMFGDLLKSCVTCDHLEFCHHKAEEDARFYYCRDWSKRI